MRLEHQLKVRGTVLPETIFSLGGSQVSVSQQTDHYLAATPVTRIREENGSRIYSRKRLCSGEIQLPMGSFWEIEERRLDRDGVEELLRRHKVLARVTKVRTTYHLGNALVSNDEVEGLGSFIEIRAAGREDLMLAAERLGIDPAQGEPRSYLELTVDLKESRWRSLLIRAHEKVIGTLIFGIISGVMLSLSIVLGMAIATNSLRAVVASILVLSGGDSFSDALGMYYQRRGDQNCPRLVAIRYAIGTFFGKCLVPLSFLVWVLILPMNRAMAVSVAWAGILIGVLAVEQAVVERGSCVKMVLKRVALCFSISILCAFIGHLVHVFIPE